MQNGEHRFAFSKKKLEALTPPASDRIYFYDTRQTGLAFCLTAAGSRTYYVYRKLHGRPLRVRLGRFDELSVEQARKRAAQEVAKINSGINPLDAKRAKREEMTLGQLFDWYIENHSRPHKRAVSVAKDQQNWNRHLKRWSGRKLSAIKRSDVQALHAKIGSETGRYAANHALEVLRHMLSMAVLHGWVSENPATGVKKFRESSRKRFLSAEELPKFLAAVDEEPREITRDYFRMLLFTGARRGNVGAMRWDEIDLAKGVWTIPDAKSKNAEPMVVHLPEPALEILRRRREGANGVPWVFPSWGACGHVSEPKHAMQRILDRAGLEDVRVHDLRRTFGSWQAATGASLLVIGKSLGHKSTSATAVYAHLDLDPVRAAVNVATAAMLATTQNGRGGGDDVR